MYIFLADDDSDDCMLFGDALKKLPFRQTLTIANNGEQLMDLLQNPSVLKPDVLFLDLNMPRKNGFQCLSEIKADNDLRNIPVVIISTSSDHHVMDQLFNNGAHFYIRKPADFVQLKSLISEVLELVSTNKLTQPVKEHFVLKQELKPSG